MDIVVRRCSELDARNQAPNASAGGGWSKGLLSVKLPKPRRSRGQGGEGGSMGRIEGLRGVAGSEWQGSSMMGTGNVFRGDTLGFVRGFATS